MVIPVGRTRSAQTLLKITKSKSGLVTRTNLGGCRFVDLIGRHGWPMGKRGLNRAVFEALPKPHDRGLWFRVVRCGDLERLARDTGRELAR